LPIDAKSRQLDHPKNDAFFSHFRICLQELFQKKF
jgi:hypothetical protein